MNQEKHMIVFKIFIRYLCSKLYWCMTLPKIHIFKKLENYKILARGYIFIYILYTFLRAKMRSTLYIFFFSTSTNQDFFLKHSSYFNPFNTTMDVWQVLQNTTGARNLKSVTLDFIPPFVYIAKAGTWWSVSVNTVGGTLHLIWSGFVVYCLAWMSLSPLWSFMLNERITCCSDSVTDTGILFTWRYQISVWMFCYSQKLLFYRLVSCKCTVWS